MVTWQVNKKKKKSSSNNLVPHHIFSNNKIKSNTLDPDLLKPSSSHLFDVGAAAIDWGKPEKTCQSRTLNVAGKISMNLWISWNMPWFLTAWWMISLLFTPNMNIPRNTFSMENSVWKTDGIEFSQSRLLWKTKVGWSWYWVTRL